MNDAISGHLMSIFLRAGYAMLGLAATVVLYILAGWMLAFAVTVGGSFVYEQRHRSDKS